MTELDLAAMLARVHGEAPNGEKVTALQVFGLHYAEEIRKCGPGSTTRIAVASKTGDAYVTELDKMLKLVRYVTLKDSSLRHFRIVP